ncbi:MAG: hypothetical protein IJM46_10545 [Oscillospiraceae bacterium]|nr:hypothetical protein [Oscillospiraceae bacterium]
MGPIDPSKYSLDYLLENKVITILSWDDVIEHGKSYSRDEVEQVTRGGRDYMCYPDDMGYPDDLSDYSGLFSGVLYEEWGDLNIDYYTHYKDGLRDGVEVEFYSSGKVKNYCVYYKGKRTGIFYEWYENGMIKKVVDYSRKERIEFNKQGKITKQGKV